MDLKPHRSRYWLHPQFDDPHRFEEQVTTICSLYRDALDLHAQGVHLMSTDEMTGIQAL